MAETTSPLLVASVLPADFAELGREVREIEKAGVDRIQGDVMDGRFVPNITVGPDAAPWAGSASWPGGMADRVLAMPAAAERVIA